MIQVNTLYLKVQDTLVKNQSGYFSNDEFNRNIELAQNDIFDFYLDLDGASQRIHDALAPFLKRLEANAGSVIPLPADYRSKRDAEVMVNQMQDGQAVFKWKECSFLQTDEAAGVRSSAVLMPSKKNSSYWFEVLSDGIHVLPEDFTGKFRMLYLCHPAAASRAVTINPTTQTEEYDEGATTNLKWNSQQFNVFHDVICFYQGFQVRESEVVQWLMARKPLK